MGNRKKVKSLATGRIDTRLTIVDPALSTFIRECAKYGEREINQQIIYMLKFACAQMSAHDLESMKGESRNG